MTDILTDRPVPVFAFEITRHDEGMVETDWQRSEHPTHGQAQEEATALMDADKSIREITLYQSITRGTLRRVERAEWG